MLKPNDSWSWYYDSKAQSLMLDLGVDMIFRVNIPSKALIDPAFDRDKFSVDDALTSQMCADHISYLPLSEPRKVELTLNCVAVKRFHKPMLPKSWFFEPQEKFFLPQQYEVVLLKNEFGEGHFIIVDNSESASMCMLVDQEPFKLNSTKQLEFCEPIKVMHDRMRQMQIIDSSYYEMVS